MKKVLDFEHHSYSPNFYAGVATRTEPPTFDMETQIITFTEIEGQQITCPQAPIRPLLEEVGPIRLGCMDKYNIKGILSSSPAIESMDGEIGLKLAREYNDWAAQISKDDPDRFLATAILPVYDVEWSCAELERCIKELGMVGWHTHSNFGRNGYLDDEKYKPLLAKAAELGAYIYMHPTTPLDKRLYRYGYSFAGAGLGFTQDAMTTTAALICSGAFDENPNLHYVMGHLGEAIPFIMERMDWGLSSPRAVLCKQKRHIIDYFRENIWVTTSGNTEKESFMLTKDVVGIDRMLVGTDYPYGGQNANGIGDMMEFLESLELTDEDRAKLYYENGEALIGRCVA